MENVVASGMTCPRCQVELASAQADLTLNACAQCGGIWLSEEDSRSAIEGLSTPTYELVMAADANATRAVDKTGWCACPQCGERMQRNRFDAARVDIDYCAGHGTWFDKGELASVHRAAMGLSAGPLSSAPDAFSSAPTAMAMEPRLSEKAIAGFVLSFFCGLIGLIVSWMAYNDIQKSGGNLRGEGLAMAGMAIGALSMVAGCLLSAMR